MPNSVSGTVADRIAKLDLMDISAGLDGQGYATVGPLLSPEECRAFIASYAEPAHFRSRVVMERHGYGRGDYQYFAYPLPKLISALRSALYRPLAAIANRWNEMLRVDVRYPEDHEEYLNRCHEAGQRRPTPLLLRYGANDYNRLHQDIYGDEAFPLQITCLLSRPGIDFTGGEFILTEQSPRM